MFIKGLKSSYENEIHTRLLNMLDRDSTIKVEALLKEYQRIINLKNVTTLIEKDSKTIKVNKIDEKKKYQEKRQKTGTKCPNCGNDSHKSKDHCPAKEKVCNYCNIKGHLIDVCRKRKKNMNQDNDEKT